jgi:hypothetical protein
MTIRRHARWLSVAVLCAPGVWAQGSAQDLADDVARQWVRGSGPEFAAVYPNYQPFLDEVVPLFREYPAVLVCHEDAQLDRLPFQPPKDFRNGFNAWKQNLSLVDDLTAYVAGRGAGLAVPVLQRRARHHSGASDVRFLPGEHVSGHRLFARPVPVHRRQWRQPRLPAAGPGGAGRRVLLRESAGPVGRRAGWYPALTLGLFSRPS